MSDLKRLGWEYAVEREPAIPLQGWRTTHWVKAKGDWENEFDRPRIEVKSQDMAELIADALNAQADALNAQASDAAQGGEG